jgi:hypothetical protein
MMRMRTPRSTGLVSVLAILLVSPSAAAFMIQTPATRGCHEEITADAWRRVQAELPETTRRLSSRGDDEALIADVPFTVPEDLDDIGVVTLLLGVRDNDVTSFAATDLGELAAVNAESAHQKHHCLRTASQDEPDGSRDALDDCHAYIRRTLLSALDGLDERGHPDPEQREAVRTTLAIRGKLTIELPIFHLRAGRALHTIQDSFTHTFRSVDDRRRVTVVLNWVDDVNHDLDESVDGPAHMRELDRCDNPDALRKERRKLATEASAAALRALLDPELDQAGREVAIDAMLERYLAFDETSDCSASNRWCNAPELAYADPNCGCAVIGRSMGSTAGASWLACALIAFARRLRWKRRFGEKRAVAVGVSLVTCLMSREARAEKAAEAEARESSESAGPVAALEGESDAGASGKQDATGSFFARVALGASYYKPGLSGGLGARYQLSRPLMLGFDAEWNPWVALSPGKLKPGAFNAYLSVIRRFQLESDAVNVRTTVALGVSALLFDLVGAPAGSVGPFFGLSFLGVEWKIRRGFYLVIDPTYIALPTPQLTGVPFSYIQYRFLVGLEFGG